MKIDFTWMRNIKFHQLGQVDELDSWTLWESHFDLLEGTVRPATEKFSSYGSCYTWVGTQVSLVALRSVMIGRSGFWGRVCHKCRIRSWMAMTSPLIYTTRLTKLNGPVTYNHPMPSRAEWEAKVWCLNHCSSGLAETEKLWSNLWSNTVKCLTNHSQIIQAI